VKALRQAAVQGAVWDRARALRLAGLWGEDGLRDLMEAAARGDSGPERLEAVEALGRLGGERARAVLTELLGDADAEVVERARQGLDRKARP
jgi:HEAT repeat protein